VHLPGSGERRDRQPSLDAQVEVALQQVVPQGGRRDIGSQTEIRR